MKWLVLQAGFLGSPREADSEMGRVFTEECPGINTCGREGRQHEWTEGETEL